MRAIVGLAAAFCLAAGSPAWALTAVGTDFYRVHVADEESGYSFGTWNAVTGSRHPAGEGRDLLFDGETTNTNYSTLRVYGSGGPRDYATEAYAPGVGEGVALDLYYIAEGPSPLASEGAGWRVEWCVEPEALWVTQDVFVVGETFATAAIYHTVEIRNMGDADVAVGWRNLYDWAVNDPSFDDGPANRVEGAAGAVVVPFTTREFLHASNPGELVRVSVDRTTEDPPEAVVPTYQPLLALGYDPRFRPDLPVTLPDAYAFVSWPYAYGSLFEYLVDPAFDATDDTAGLSWFGLTAETAPVLSAGDTVRFTQVLFGALPSAPPGKTSPVPEPSTLALLATGLAVLARRRGTSPGTALRRR
ncbi:MAG: PEP-CTERM sorting domain-containing protein [Thermodesulfobacteriota bacterium]